MSRLPKTISVEKLDNSVLFTFAQNQHYLYDGTIEVPFNSLSIIADKSEAITLRKSASNDIFISAPWQNFDITASSKEDVVDALVEMLYDEAGISQEEVQDMIDAATSGIPSSQVIEQLRTDVNTISGNVQTLSGEVATKADASDLQALSEKVDTKLDASAYTPTDLSEYWTSAETKSYVDDALDDYYDKDEVDTLMGNKQDVLTAGDNITISGNVISAEAGNNIIELTQAEYDALTEKDPDALYIITDASEINMNDYWTSAETKSYVDGKVDDALDDYWTSAETQNAINASTSGIPSSQVIEQLRTDVNTISGNVENNYYDKEYIDEKEEVVASALTQLNLRLNEDEEVTAAALNDLNDRIGSGGGALFVDFDDLMNNMNDDKWDELVNALQNNKPIFYCYDYSEGDSDTTDVGQSPVDGYIFIDQTEGEEAAEISLKKLYGGGYRDLYIVKNGSEDYEVTDNSFDYQPMLQAGSGISIDENNVISVTVDSELDETSNNPVANSAITNVIIDDEEVISRAINELNDRLVAVESGGSSVTVDTSLDSGSTNPVANSAITVALDGKANTSDLTIITNNVETISGAVDDAKAYYISFATLATQGITDNDWDGIVAAIDAHRPIYAGYPRQDGGIIYYGVECMNKNSGNTEIVMTASDNSAHYFYTFTKNGSNDYSYTVSTKPYVPDITTAITSGSTDSEIPTAKAVYDATQSGGGGVTVDPTLDTGSTNPVANSAITSAINAKADASTTYTKTEVNNLVNNKFWCGTQAQYDALATKENDVLYLIHN